MTTLHEISKSANKKNSTTQALRKLQHAVVILDGKDVKSLNTLLVSGWRVIHSSNMTNGASLVIIETEATQELIDEFKELLGLNEG